MKKVFGIPMPLPMNVDGADSASKCVPSLQKQNVKGGGVWG